jgi:hypothetical protein
MLTSIEKMVEKIELDYVGFGPNTTSVKPVHLANGLFRTVHGSSYSVKLLNRFVFSETKKGKVPKGHELESIYEDLSTNGRIDSRDIRPEDLPKFRRLLKNIVGADSAVFEGGMASYSAGNQYFLSRDSIAQDGGELVAKCLNVGETHLYDYLQAVLQSDNDVVSLLCAPLLPRSDEDNAGKQPARADASEITEESTSFPPFLMRVALEDGTGQFRNTGKMWSGIFAAANTLANHLGRHPNKLFNLRLVTLFASYIVIRHLGMLEAYYVPEAEDRIPPFLLDFSPSASDPIAKASLQTYTRTTQSIVRFYGWALSEYLRSEFDNDADQLLRQPAPLYKGRTANGSKLSKKAQREVNEAQEIWEIAKLRADEEGDTFRVFGEAIYDMLSTQASADAIKYLRALGLRSGILYPPNQSTHRFSVKQDILEMLVRGAVEPGETIGLSELQRRFRERYKFIIGGDLQDEQDLREIGIYQFDRNALIENRKRFASALRQLDFAEMLADGVLQVRL